MKRTIIGLLLAILSLSKVLAQEHPITKESFVSINLNYPGLEKAKNAFTASKYNEAAQELLNYYRKKDNQKAPDFSNAEKTVDLNSPLDPSNRAAADSALLHKFQPQKGYGFFDYGKDINWQLWPVKDNEVRWQLHRVKWWQSLALAYRSTKNEKYTKEWMLQFADWTKKNPFGLSADNDRFAWRPLEVSDRLQSLVPTFSIFVNSSEVTPQFLMFFLNSYHEQAQYIPTHYATEGNHRLFEAQRELFAGASFPEFKNAAAWRKSGIEVLNAEIKKQVYPDGVQFELSPVYHASSIDIFLKAYRTAQKAQVENEFPASYKQTVEKMVMAFISITFPNYNQPMFGDSWLAEKRFRMQQFQSWLSAFPNNDAIRYFATDGKEGKTPDFLSKGLTTAGFYTFRNGWTDKATIMILKASPPGEFHAQPDNGTFELWVNGRNFTPDAGCFVYSGDAEITKMRNWYRQTRVHSTLTLNNENMVITKAQLNKWETSKNLDILTYTNPSYTDLNHQRSVLFIDQKYFLILDKAIGKATGNLGIHFQLKEDSKPVFDQSGQKVYTTYADGNNLLIQSLNTDKVTLLEEDGKVSYAYQKELKRPALVFEKQKNNDKTQQFISVVYPYTGNKAPQISIKENAGNNYATGALNITLTINGVSSTVHTTLQ
ncbi:heparinase [Pedobacter sp. HMWF019]|uniref:heparin-sulfate lyase HepC n=1 Tax=Pedobacter sp. HMWF019 TaxID=2056856 RepID=UPI000D334991|nr:heparin-sulfate lyase HepC [Pedobacter sp. HMWF019]PTS96890.1 heparinase [Pedobacter sp. HMWF019]